MRDPGLWDWMCQGIEADCAVVCAVGPLGLNNEAPEGRCRYSDEGRGYASIAALSLPPIEDGGG